MSFARLKSSGSGAFGMRVSIEGSPYDFVTHTDMQTTDDEGRIRYVGLKSDSFKISERIDQIRAKHEGEAIRITIADVAGRATELFAKRPTLTTYLTADTDDTDGSPLTVLSTAGWPSEGVLHIDREAIDYEVSSGTEFTIVQRGFWSTLAAYHYTADGGQLRFPEITDWPVLWDGRRVRIYAYGHGDSPTGNGTLIWIGIMVRSPTYGGSSWSFSVDPLTRIFDAELGSDLADPCPIRGIYYPWTAPLYIRIEESTDSVPTPTPQGVVTFAVAGFWETQRDFLDDLNTYIAAQQAAAAFGSFTQDVIAIEFGSSWGFQFTTGTAGNEHMMKVEVYSEIDVFDPTATPQLSSDLSETVVEVSASTTYVYAQQDPAFGTVPRAVFGESARINDHASVLPDANKYGLDAATNPSYRIYLGGVAQVTSATTAVNVEWQSSGLDGGVDPFTADVTALSSGGRYVDLDYDLVTFVPHTGHVATYNAPFYSAVGGELPKIRQGRSYGTGTLLDLITTLTEMTAQYVNLGAVPDLRIADFDFVFNEITEAATGLAVSQRSFTGFAPITVRDLIEPECQLIGVHPAMYSDGTITFRRLRLPSPTEVTGKTITSSSALIDKQWVSYEPSALGVFNTLRLRTGYDPIEDEHRGTTWVVRDVAAFGQAPSARVVEIAPHSEARNPITQDDVIQCAARMLGVYGGRYAMLTVEVPLTKFDYLLGDAVSITWSKVPDSDGTLGVSEKIGIIVEREFEPRAARGKLVLLTTDQRIGGYVPASKITSISGTSGTDGPFTVTLNSTDYWASGVTATDLWTSGDLVRVYKWNGATASAVNFTVASVTATTLTFVQSPTWTHAGSTWAVGSQVSTSITAASQKAYAYEAHADGLVDFSGAADQQPYTFGP